MDVKKTIDKTAPSMMTISFLLNNKPVQMEVSPTARLTDILRNDLALTGTKISCGIGRCGACSVIMDGKLVNSCLIFAYQANQASIKTIESVSENGIDPIQQAFLQEGGFQCGYCTPGMVMAVKALLAEKPQPSETEIAEALSGNLCRCTGYSGIIRAIYQVTREHE